MVTGYAAGNVPEGFPFLDIMNLLPFHGLDFLAGRMADIRADAER